MNKTLYLKLCVYFNYGYFVLPYRAQIIPVSMNQYPRKTMTFKIRPMKFLKSGSLKNPQSF